ncbi:MAG: RNA methyltransferase [Candidatus Omnitrophica bacterium]|nr:RNA methyltransferase [Candidatus Omnitrophota bacterium]
MITDIQSDSVITVNRLRTRDYRKLSGLVIVEGYPEVSRAVKAGIPIDVLYICPEIFTPTENEFTGLNVVEVSKDVFAKMAFGSRLKGILAICRPKQLQLNDIVLKPNPLIVVLENVEKPGNLGAVIRTSDGAGVDAVIMCDGKTDIFNHHVVRSSIGTIFCVQTVSAEKEELYSYLKQNNIQIFTATAKANNVYTAVDFRRGSAIILGNEHDGVSEFWQERSDQSIKIPMLGQASSLNVTVSASILIYEAHRQRNF